MIEKLPILYTVGHSVHPFEQFIHILMSNEIQAIADVRSSPYSKYTPQYNKEILKESLNNSGIHYVFLGEELGARRNESECFVGNKVVYRKVASTPIFQKGLLRLKEGALKMRVAIMCAEKDPLTCHRTILVAHFARAHFSDTLHILEDGSIETGQSADERLLAECKLDKDDLFFPYNERLEIAYAKRAEKIAYEEDKEQETHE